MKVFDKIFNRSKIIHLPFLEEIEVCKSDIPDYKYNSFKEECYLEHDAFQTDLYLNNLDDKNIKTISFILDNLERIHSSCKCDFLENVKADFMEYIDGIYNTILTEKSFHLATHNVSQEERFLGALHLVFLEIKELRQEITVTLKYTFGYEFLVTYKFNERLEIISFEMTAGCIVAKAQLSKFVLRFDDSDVQEVLDRFCDNWWNTPIRSYYIYTMYRKINDTIHGNKN